MTHTGAQEWGRSGAAKEGPVAAVKEEVLFEAPVSAPSRSDSSDAETAQEVTHTHTHTHTHTIHVAVDERFL